MKANPHFRPGQRYKVKAPSRGKTAEQMAAVRAAKAAKAEAGEPKAPTIAESALHEMGHADDSPAQVALLKSFYGLPLTEGELAIWRRSTGRDRYPGRPFSELTVIAGAQSGKDARVAAPIVVWEAVHGGHERLIRQGEPVRVVLVAQDFDSAKNAFGYIAAILARPAFAGRVARVLADSIELRSGVVIECFSCTKSSMRGRMIPVAVMDELAYFRLAGSANSDEEIQTAIRRGQLLIPTAKVVKISTPYMRSGVLHDDFKRYFGQDSPDVLVWRSTTAEMNPAVTAEALGRMRRTMSPAAFRREFEGEFSEDVSQFLSDAWVDAADSGDARDLPRALGVKYAAGVDPSGSGRDAFALSVAHREGDRVVQDLVRAWEKPRGERVDLDGIVAEICRLLREYGVERCHGDRYAPGWVAESFRRHGVSYQHPARRDRDGSEAYLDRSALYLECERLFATGQLSLRGDERTLREFRNLERRPSQGGRDRVDHPRGGSDDRANASAISFVLARAGGGLPKPAYFIPRGAAGAAGGRGPSDMVRAVTSRFDSGVERGWRRGLR